MAANKRFPWVGVSAVVAFIIISAAAWLRVPEGGTPAASGPNGPALVLTRVDALLSSEVMAERLAAYDPTPLFLPSSMSSSEPPLPAGARDRLAGPFGPIPPNMTKVAGTRFPAAQALPRNPLEGLRLTERADSPLVLARGDDVGAPLPARVGQLEVVDLGGGHIVLTLELSASGEMPAIDWQPVEMAGAVNRAGLVGELVVIVSSGSEEIDDYFRVHLRKTTRIGARLPQGFYTFRVGP